MAVVVVVLVSGAVVGDVAVVGGAVLLAESVDEHAAASSAKTAIAMMARNRIARSPSVDVGGRLDRYVQPRAVTTPPRTEQRFNPVEDRMEGPSY